MIQNKNNQLAELFNWESVAVGQSHPVRPSYDLVKDMVRPYQKSHLLALLIGFIVHIVFREKNSNYYPPTCNPHPHPHPAYPKKKERSKPVSRRNIDSPSNEQEKKQSVNLGCSK